MKITGNMNLIFNQKKHIKIAFANHKGRNHEIMFS